MTRCENCGRVGGLVDMLDLSTDTARVECWETGGRSCWRARAERLQAELSQSARDLLDVKARAEHLQIEQDTIRTQARAEAIAECVAWLRAENERCLAMDLEREVRP